jgi:acetyl-CoA decarbonylase/synthase complex subunit delta
MGFKAVPQKFNATIKEVTVGTGEGALKLGGEQVFQLYGFDGPIVNKPAVGAEVSDLGPDRTVPGIASFYQGADSIPDAVAKACTMPGASFVSLALDGADPSGENRSAEECAALAKACAEKATLPLVIQGSGNVEKDKELFPKVAEALQGKNVLLLSAREENYKPIAVAAVQAYGQKIGAESSVDINLAKQLNVLVSQMGVTGNNVVMNVGCAVAGYGFEYVASTIERVKAAALAQSDAMLQMPIITPLAADVWGVKETVVSEEDFPEWGPREARGVNMEVCTAMAVFAAGSNAVILRHPESVAVVSKLVSEII